LIRPDGMETFCGWEWKFYLQEEENSDQDCPAFAE